MTSEIPEPNPLIVEAERFGLFVSGVTDYAIYMLSPQGIVSSWNAGAEHFKGYKAHEIIGKHFSNFYTPSDIASGLPERALKTALTQGKFEDEGLRVRQDGTQFWASVVIDPIRDANGELLGFTKITRDVTDRRQAADALRASEEQLRLLVQGVTDYAIYMLSVDGIITNWNAGAQRIKGYDASEAIGTHFSRFYTEEDRATNLPAYALSMAAKSDGFENEGWRVRKDGSRFWAHVVIDPIRNDAGELIGFAKITRDVTERRETSAALAKANEALFQSQKMESLGKLTGGVAHDFNNLLSVIANGVALLRMAITDPSQIKALDSMERATSRGATLTQQLLSFAKQQPLKQEKQDLNRVINSFESVLRRALKSSIDFRLKLAPILPSALVDAPQFEAALLNLVVNSADAVGLDGTITVQTELVELVQGDVNELAAGRYIHISVSDTGEGIAPDLISRVVEPFFTTKPVGKGTGLGLSQVYGLMQQSNGGMKIESVKGSGTTVSLYLPALDYEKIEEPFPSKQSHKALVVDDQPDVLDMAAELFRTLGYDVFSASNGTDALSLLERNQDIGLLFSDVVMPGISGMELARSARKLIPGIKIILATGYIADVISKEERESNAFPIISKPYKIADIVQYLRA